jgi:hypothetical protein
VGGVKYYRAHVWKTLKKHPRISAVELAKKLDMKRTLLTRILWGMKDEGFVANNGNRGPLTVYWALGDSPPRCRIPETRNTEGLNTDPRVARQRIALALAARGHKLKPPPAPANDGCLLAECWSTPSCTKRAA